MSTPHDPLLQDTIQANQSPRFRILDLYERYVDGTQYEGRPPFFADTAPLLDRAPCIVVPLAEEAIRSHAALVLGEDHFPKFTSHPAEDDSDEAEDQEDEGGFGLSKDDSEALDKLVSKIGKQIEFQPVARRLLEAAMGCGTAVGIAGVKNGRLFVETTRAKWCSPEFGPDGEVTRLEIRYPYIREEKDPITGNIKCEALLYRRVIDQTADTVYKPAKASFKGEEPDHWTPDVRVEHGLGFCPVLWYRFMSEVSCVGDIDGKAIHGKILDELDALNFAVSQRHRATLTTLDPILVETGVDEDDPPPAPTVDQASSIFQNAAERANAQWGTTRRGGQPKKGRMRAPGMAYSYPNPDTKVELLTLPGDAMVAGDNNAKDLEAKICEALHWVPLDPKTLQISSNLSGRAIEWLHKKQVEFCAEVRTDCGTHLLLALLSLLLRVALTVGKRNGLYLNGVRKAIPILERFLLQERLSDGYARTVWVLPEIDLCWPEFFANTDVDEQAVAMAVIADLKAGIIDLRTAVQKRAEFYGIANVDQYVATLEANKPEKPAQDPTEDPPPDSADGPSPTGKADDAPTTQRSSRMT